MADNIIKPKNVNDQQWNQALELYNMAKSKGDRYPELTVAQAALETGWFKSPAGRYNYFGQKASKGQEGSVKSTREVSGGASYMTQAKFRDYGNLGEAVDDRLTKWGKKYQGAGNVEDAIGTIWKYNPKTKSGEGYASDPQYGPILKNILGSMGVKTSDTGNVNAGTTARPDAGIDYQSLTPEQKAYFDAQVAQYHNIREAEKSKEDAEADQAKAEIAQKQKEQAFLEEMKQRAAQKPQREQQQQAPQFDGSAYRIDQQQMPTVQYAQLPETTFQKGGQNNIPITTRQDFNPGILSKIPGLTSLASGNQPGLNRQDMYGPLGDLYKYYGGQPLTHGVLIESQNKPANSKDQNAKYISLNRDPKFVKEVLDNYTRVSSGKLDKGIEKKLSDTSWAVSGYSSAGKNAHRTKEQGSEHHSNALGRYTLGRGKDEKGEYISYYDKFDQGTGSGMNPGEMLGVTKPFEVYDRIYIKDVKRKYENGGEEERKPSISPEARSMGDAGIRFGNKFSTSIGANLRDKNIRTGASYNNGNFSTDINYTRGLDNTSSFSGNASYNPGKYNIDLSYDKGPEGNRNLSAGAGYNGENLSGNVRYNQDNQDRSLSGDVRYGRGNFSGSLGTNFILGKDFNPNVRGDIGYQNRNLSTSIGAEYNRETGIEPNIRATYRFQDGGEIEGRRFNPKKKQRARLGYFAEGGVSIEDETIDYNQGVSDIANEIDPVKKTPVNYREVREGAIRDAVPTFNRQKVVIDVKPKVVPVPYTERRETYTTVKDVIPNFKDEGLQKVLGDKKEQESLAKQGKEKWEALKKINPDIDKAIETLGVMETQKKLYELGYDLGNYGKNKDGIDGIMGRKTKAAFAEFSRTGGPAQGALSLEQEERIARLKKPEVSKITSIVNYLGDKKDQVIDVAKEAISDKLPYNLQYNPKLDTVGQNNEIEGGLKYLLDNKSLSDIRKEKNISFLQISKNRKEGNSTMPIQFKERIANSTNPQGYAPEVNIDEEGNINIPFFDRLSSEESKTKQVKRLPGVGGNRREDIFRMYSGLPQKYDTFTASSFKAGKDSDTNVTFKNPEDIADYVKIAATHTDLFKKLANGEITPETIAKDKLSGKKGGDKINKAGFKDPKNVMWNATFGVDFDKKGNPYLSFYDDWDLSAIKDGKYTPLKNVYGKPIEIYDRIPLTQELVKQMAKLSFKADDLSPSDAIPTDDKSLIAITKKMAENPIVKKEYEKLLDQIKQRYK